MILDAPRSLGISGDVRNKYRSVLGFNENCFQGLIKSEWQKSKCSAAKFRMNSLKVVLKGL